ncbi:MGDG synthase family glycosyltransferase [Lentibacillus amyloliquefaciens]|uniref:UDP-glucuronosyltransferase n=1 Tax=Lentibacillus amyloliquefaciens TaxID=1472767 RepID=A0A0U4FRM2_9BACI|nr:glycosyltransferase [Lentibacillus amyloliquefaciens]ALX50356.1 UDP-glucuronosyltransferase [Lentibacillus amyloliquefaciens]
MEKALFLPFMQLQTGHHHVADALIAEINSCRNDIVCDKVDILSYSYGRMEKVISAAYLNWIKYFPDVYDRLYRFTAYKKEPFHNRRYLYEAMFMYFFKRLTNRNDVRILFCTHALPSNIASVLKLKNKLSSVTVNVYTDYFVNDLWGIEGIDYHLVPTLTVKDYLTAKGVRPEAIYVTGIPVDNVFQKADRRERNSDLIKVLVTGGSLGVGSLKSMLPALNSGKVHYYILCGKNDILYQDLLRIEQDSVTPIPYITRKAEMNKLYNQVDAVLTKPGGVTISECLLKRKPIFLYNPLPGQERINAEQMKLQGTAIPVDKDNNLEEQLLQFFTDENRQRVYDDNVDVYHRYLDRRPLSDLLQEMLNKKH